MKSIVVRSDNKVSVYSSGWHSRQKEDGTWEEVVQSESEMEQHCYQQLIESTKREEFDRVAKSIILGYLNWEESNLENLKIRVDGKDGRMCEMNISGPIDWSKIQTIKLPLTADGQSELNK